MEDKNLMMFVKAMILKRISRNQEAQELYHTLIKSFQYKEGFNLMRNIVQMLMFPFAKDKRKQQQYTEDLFDKLYNFQQNKVDDKKSLWNCNCLNNDYTIKEDYKNIVLVKLADLPFFNRYTKDELLPFVTKLKVRYYNKNDVVFPDDKVLVVKDGSLHVWSHKENQLEPDIIAKLQAGSVIGHKSDRGLTNDSENWILNFSEGTEIIEFEKSDFEELWKINCLDPEKMRLYNFLCFCPLLTCLSESTLKSLIFDKAEVLYLNPGQLISRVSKRSAINYDYKNFIKTLHQTSMSAAAQKEQYKNGEEP